MNKYFAPITFIAGLLLDIFIVWLIFRTYDVVPDKLEEWIMELLT